MKVLMVTGDYLPGKNGGIENYTQWLATILLQQNFEVEVAALNLGEIENYKYKGVGVHNLKSNFSSFGTLLKNGKFDICHFHEYSEYGGIEIPWFQKAKEYCKKVFFTFHLPYLTCYKGDFRFNGIEDCNTFSNSKRCTKCVIADKIGYDKIWRSELYLSSVWALMTLTGQKRTLQKRITGKYQKLNELVTICDNLFIYADWFKTILAKNGFDSKKIIKIPYKTKSAIPDLTLRDNSVKNKMLFVGRIQHQKGLHLLCKAMNHPANKNISLDVYGNIVDQAYFENCLKEYEFNFKGTTNYLQLLKELKEYDFLVLPSVFTEMYSLIMKDAFYEQLPVIVSEAKGNKDAITDGVNGFLFKYEDATDLAKVINKAYRLKEGGWEPEFEFPRNPEENIEDIMEIISYYSNSIGE